MLIAFIAFYFTRLLRTYICPRGGSVLQRLGGRPQVIFWNEITDSSAEILIRFCILALNSCAKIQNIFSLAHVTQKFILKIRETRSS